MKELSALGGFSSTVRSLISSKRIEGSIMSDEEVEVLPGKIDITKIMNRVSLEVAGYFEIRDLISESCEDIKISVSNL